ncbi:DoxX family membrane protein [Nocardia brasiliensis]|uniref:DoxX family membrane protein n=1 Tax=Nocardia brasiliensis TaxID=37326 RepID=A0A6G9XNS4_NOCBR|nr:DoxX family protein [Nocardia brasiliensis]QIS02602.1 DoxX family membrane protein [Nocardia brasiliensis]
MTAIPAAARPGKVKNRVLWTLQILLGLFFIIASALPKLFGQADAVKSFDTIGWGDWFRYFTGVVELAGGIGLLVPLLGGLAAAGLSILTVLAAATQVFLLDAPELVLFPLVLAVLFAWIAYERRDTVVALRKRLSS